MYEPVLTEQHEGYGNQGEITYHVFPSGESLVMSHVTEPGIFRQSYLNLTPGQNLLQTQITSQDMWWLSERTGFRFEDYFYQEPTTITAVLPHDYSDLAIVDLGRNKQEVHLHPVLEIDEKRGDASAEKSQITQKAKCIVDDELRLMIQNNDLGICAGEALQDGGVLMFAEISEQLAASLESALQEKNKGLTAGKILSFIYDTSTGNTKILNSRSVLARPTIPNLADFGKVQNGRRMNDLPNVNAAITSNLSVLKNDKLSNAERSALTRIMKAEQAAIKRHLLRRIRNNADWELPNNRTFRPEEESLSLPPSLEEFMRDWLTDEINTRSQRYAQELANIGSGKTIAPSDIYKIQIASAPSEEQIEHLIDIPVDQRQEVWPRLIAELELVNEGLVKRKAEEFAEAFGYLSHGEDEIDAITQNVISNTRMMIETSDINQVLAEYGLDAKHVYDKERIIKKVAEHQLLQYLIQRGYEYLWGVNTIDDDLLTSAFSAKGAVLSVADVMELQQNPVEKQGPLELDEITKKHYEELRRRVYFQGSLGDLLQEVNSRLTDTRLRTQRQEYQTQLFGRPIDAINHLADMVNLPQEVIKLVSAVQIAKPDINLYSTAILVEVLRKMFDYPIEHVVMTLDNDLFAADESGVKTSYFKVPLLMRSGYKPPFFHTDNVLHGQPSLQEGITLSDIKATFSEESPLAEILKTGAVDGMPISMLHRRLMRAAGIGEHQVDMKLYNKWWVGKLLQSPIVTQSDKLDYLDFYVIDENGYQNIMPLGELKTKFQQGEIPLDMIRPSSNTYYNEVPMYFGLFGMGEYVLFDGLIGNGDEFDQKVVDGSENVTVQVGAQPLVIETSWLSSVRTGRGGNSIIYPLQPNFSSYDNPLNEVGMHKVTATSTTIPHAVFDSGFRDKYAQAITARLKSKHPDILQANLTELHKEAIEVLLSLI